ncbi:L,D-transpeptidase family protein [Gramella sp. AN32]|uniref:Murein L,D-transpeptidase n=1 Tax=Christiangramia antarctica TaxID=2058158 RepID=A0ABW5X5V9_9FLAO|nr:L,D-transpeptidase family protein [Gramella sp. AN32]MCM4154786.1 hypothetical protein [Gramella sp. AN32]
MKHICAYSIFLVLFLASSCKNKEKLGVEERNDVKEVFELTSAKQIQDYFIKIDSTSAEYGSPLYSFYSENDFQPVWNSRELREDLFRNIETIEKEGLYAEDYNLESLKNTLSNLDEISEKKRFDLEILLTQSYFTLAHDLYYGKLDPKKIFEIWGIDRDTIDLSQSLKTALKAEAISKELEKLKPTSPIYYSLKRNLQDYKNLANKKDSLQLIPSGKIVRPGDKEPRIPLVKTRLKNLGYFKETSDSIEDNFTSELQDAIKNFQEDHLLEIDGLIGNNTIKNLNYSAEDRYHQLLVNLERWRWFPRNLGEHYILINIPEYHLSVVKEGDTVARHDVMVGVQARETPVFSDHIDYVVYNPTWTIPPTIKKNDVIPGARKNLGYLADRNIEVYQGGNKLDPQNIDWSSNAPYNFTYRQEAGPSNPLGRVKIIYPNKYLIYLHDTPSRDLFSKNSRARSSGCVRVQGALDLAEYLLDDQKKYDHDEIEEILASGKTKEIKVKKDVSVHHLYWTAVVKDKNLQFVDDVYDQDEKIWKLLQPTNLKK